VDSLRVQSLAWKNWPFYNLAVLEKSLKEKVTSCTYGFSPPRRGKMFLVCPGILMNTIPAAAVRVTPTSRLHR
jgi:hypothetical protein